MITCRIVDGNFGIFILQRMKVIYFMLSMITKLLLLLPFNNKYTEIKNFINVTDSNIANYIKLVKLWLRQSSGFGSYIPTIPYDIFIYIKKRLATFEANLE